MARRQSLWVCEDDPLYRAALAHGLGADFDLRVMAGAAELLAELPAAAPDAVLLDLHLPNANDGFLALQRLRRRWPQLPIVVHSGRSEADLVVKAMRLGAHDFVPKGCTMATLKQLLAEILRQRARPRPASLQPQQAKMVGHSLALQRLREAIAQVQPYPGNVIVVGESGSGKELVARALHEPPAAFVAVDVGTLAQATVDSALFGHERGAYTGAERSRAGLIEQAHGGILYFDEVANMPLDVQARLLRVLQEKEVVRLGGDVKRPVQFRVVCASHEDLGQLCAQGRFRYDLWMRLEVFTLEVPPLRQRREDIPALVRHILVGLGSPKADVTEAAMAVLLDYPWPGNVRELGNVIQSALARAGGGCLDVDHLPAKMALAPPAKAPLSPAGSLAAQLGAHERQIIAQAYERVGGNIAKLARTLEVDRSHLYTKLREHRIYAPKTRQRRQTF